jgi:hypothetical protein
MAGNGMSRTFNACRWSAGGAVLAVLLLGFTPLRADDHNVDLDRSVDYSKLKTFIIRPGTIDSGRQELKNSLVLKKLTDAIRAALQSKGLTELATQPNVIVEFTASGVDYNIGPGGIARPAWVAGPGRFGRTRPRGFRHRDAGDRRQYSTAHTTDLAWCLP